MNEAVIIVAGGMGTRVGGDLPKQFIELKGKPIIFHAIEQFTKANSEIQVIVVMHPEYISMWEELCERYGVMENCELCAGGDERFHSVRNGLDLLGQDCAVVAIHDAVRPFVSESTILRCFAEARNSGAAIPVIPIYDSLRKVDGEESRHEDRSLYRAVQTPQCFDAEILKAAYRQPYDPSFTDDASVVEAFGQTVRLVDGNRANFKITTPFDLLLAEAILN